MSCRPYINNLSKNPRVQNELDKLHNSIFNRLIDSKLFNKWEDYHFLPTNQAKYTAAKNLISQINEQYKKKVAGTSFTKATGKEFVFVNVKNFVKEFEEGQSLLEAQQVDEFGDSVPLGITNTKNEYFDITKSKFEEKDKIVDNSGAKTGKYGYYYVLNKEQQKNYKDYSKKHVNSVPGSSKEGFELSRNLNQVVYLKKVRGKHYLYIDLKHLVNHNGVLLPEVYGKVKFPIDLVFYNEEEKYLKSFKEEKPFISEQEQEIRKLMFKTAGISAPKAANFYIFNIKDAIVKLVKNLGGNISYSELNNITEENLDYIKSLVNIDEKVDKLAKDYKKEIDNLDEDQLKLQIISSVESDYDSDTLQGIWKVINRLPVSFLKLLSFEFVDSSTAYFMAGSDKNKDPKSVDVRSITENESIIIGTSINVALRRMLDDGFITSEELDKLNKRIRTDIDVYLKAQKGKILTYEHLKQFIKRSSYIKYLSKKVSYQGQTHAASNVFEYYRDKAIYDIEEYTTRQNKGIVEIVDFLSKLQNKRLNKVHTNITLGKFDLTKDLLKFPIDYTVIASPELGHAVDYYLQTTKPEIRGKLNNFITQLTLLPEFSNYLEKGLYSRNYNINDTKEIAADLYAWMMAKSAGYDVSNSHISSLDKFMYDNEVVVERLFKRIFDIKTPSPDISSIKSNPIETVTDYIKRLINGLVEWVNESLNTTLYSSDNGEIKLEPAGLAVQRLLSALDRLTMRDENFDVESILNSQTQKDFFNGVKNELYKKEVDISKLSDIEKRMYQSDSQGFISFLRDQLYGLSNGVKVYENPPSEKSMVERYGKELIALAKESPMYNRVDYKMKVINNILSNKEKVDKWLNNKSITPPSVFWEKLQKDLQIPRPQVDLLAASEGNTFDEKLANFMANYSYTIEINTARKGVDIYDMPSTPEDPYQSSFNINGRNYIADYQTKEFLYRNEVVEFDQPIPEDVYITYDEFKQAEKHYVQSLKERNKGTNSDYYSNLTVPGGTNYTENEIATPLITPSIKGHAQFATDKGIGWFRSDDKHPFTGFLEDLIASGTIKKVPCG